MLRSLNAIVLSSVPVGSGGVVIRTFTDLEGKLSFLVRGLHSKNAIFKPSYLQPLVVLKVSADIRANRQLHYIRDATIEPAPQSLFTNPSTRALSFFVAEVLQRSLHDFQPLKPLFEFTVTWIGQLDQYKGAQGYRVLWYLEFFHIMPGSIWLKASALPLNPLIRIKAPRKLLNYFIRSLTSPMSSSLLRAPALNPNYSMSSCCIFASTFRALESQSLLMC
jgi:hypothetical protein